MIVIVSEDAAVLKRLRARQGRWREVAGLAHASETLHMRHERASASTTLKCITSERLQKVTQSQDREKEHNC